MDALIEKSPDGVTDRFVELGEVPEPSPPVGAAAGPRLPALGLFRAFDAVVRHRSFRRAADELCVTPSAVSQQIRQLEQHFQVRLFRRLPRRIELTREGAGLATAVREAIAMLTGACRQIAQPAQPTVICASVAPALASRWLIKHLKMFMNTHPDIRVMLQATNDDVDFRREDVDIAIRWGRTPWPSCRSALLAADVILPVCSPDYLRECGLIEGQDLGRATQLHVIGQGNQWSDWLTAAGLPAVTFRDILYFSDGALMLEAAAQGQGICLASSLLVAHELASGRLVQPFAAELRLDEGYYILLDRAIEPRPAVEAFCAWMVLRATQSIAAMPDRPASWAPLPEAARD